MSDAATREQLGDRLAEQATAATSRARELRRTVGELAGRIAQTEDEVARIHEQIAECAVSAIAAQAPEHAQRARRFAEHERRQQQRWSAAG